MQGYRTLLFNALAALMVVADALAQIGTMPEVLDVIPEDWMPFFTAAVILANVILRVATTTPVGRKPDVDS